MSFPFCSPPFFRESFSFAEVNCLGEFADLVCQLQNWYLPVVLENAGESTAVTTRGVPRASRPSLQGCTDSQVSLQAPPLGPLSSSTPSPYLQASGSDQGLSVPSCGQTAGTKDPSHRAVLAGLPSRRAPTGRGQKKLHVPPGPIDSACWGRAWSPDVLTFSVHLLTSQPQS